MEDEFFENEYEDYQPEFQAEQKAFERAGPSGKLTEMLSGASLGDMQKNLARDAISPEDRFLIAVDALSRRITSDTSFKLTQNDINIMLEKTSNIVGLRYKNPAGYILGYLATKGGVSMDPGVVSSVIKYVLPSVADDSGLAPPDVIRYSRFWLNL